MVSDKLQNICMAFYLFFQNSNLMACNDKPQQLSDFTYPLSVSSENSSSESNQSCWWFKKWIKRAVEKSHLTKLSPYFIALRPWSYTASFSPVALGACLFYKSYGSFNVLIFFLTCISALSVHAAGNLVNTYYDYTKGIDTKKSDDRTLVDQLVSPNDVSTMGAISYIIGCFGFLSLSYISPTPMEHIALLYFGGLSSSFLYTGGLGLKYIALGDLVIFLTFGPVTVLFAYIAQGGPLSIFPLWYALPLALNTESILHANNSRDTGKRSRSRDCYAGNF